MIARVKLKRGEETCTGYMCSDGYTSSSEMTAIEHEISNVLSKFRSNIWYCGDYGYSLYIRGAHHETRYIRHVTVDGKKDTWDTLKVVCEDHGNGVSISTQKGLVNPPIKFVTTLDGLWSTVPFEWYVRSDDSVAKVIDGTLSSMKHCLRDMSISNSFTMKPSDFVDREHERNQGVCKDCKQKEECICKTAVKYDRIG